MYQIFQYWISEIHLRTLSDNVQYFPGDKEISDADHKCIYMYRNSVSVSDIYLQFVYKQYHFDESFVLYWERLY